MFKAQPKGVPLLSRSGRLSGPTETPACSSSACIQLPRDGSKNGWVGVGFLPVSVLAVGLFRLCPGVPAARADWRSRLWRGSGGVRPVYPNLTCIRHHTTRNLERVDEIGTGFKHAA